MKYKNKQVYYINQNKRLLFRISRIIWCIMHCHKLIIFTKIARGLEFDKGRDTQDELD